MRYGGATNLPILCLLLLFREPPQAEAHARQSYILAQQGRQQEAEAEIREAIRLAPENALYHSALAGLLTKNNDWKGAAEELGRALNRNPPPATRAQLLERLQEADLQLGAELARAASFQDGLQLALAAAKLFPQNSRILQMLGYFQSKLQLSRDAAQSYARSLALDPASAEASVGLGMAQFSAGLEQDAIRTLEAGITRFPRDAAHYQALGVVLIRNADENSGMKARARSLFEKALAIDDSLSEAHYQLGAMALDANDSVSAKAHLLASERDAPNDSRVHYALARLYRQQGDTAAAEREMKAFLAIK